MGIMAVLGGPTASGKSVIALQWAKTRQWEIISADSRQMYRGFCIGTGAPSPEELRVIPHHFVGFLPGSEIFSPKLFRDAVENLLERNPQTGYLLVGGTGLYLKELLYPAKADRGETPDTIRQATAQKIETEGLAAVHTELSTLDPKGMVGVHVHDRYRIQKRWENYLITGGSYLHFQPQRERDSRFTHIPFYWLNPLRPKLHQNIEMRIHHMLQQGWVEETQTLLKEFDPETTPAFKALGYREIAEAVLQKTSLTKAVELIHVNTRQYAKRQTTFFRNQFPGSIAIDPFSLQQKLEASGWE